MRLIHLPEGHSLRLQRAKHGTYILECDTFGEALNVVGRCLIREIAKEFNDWKFMLICKN